ncbi:MAG: DUF948 domain-containing protein [Deltaproteobacteria bacterium]|nr:DUF948 domain-containing protein [Deltaproteobacteria bacterium]
MNPTLATLLTISVTSIAAILVLILIFFIPVLLQVRRTAKEAEKLIDSVRVQVAPISRDIGLISRDVQSITQFIHRQADRVETGIETVQDMAVRVKAFQIEIQRRIVKPLGMLTSVLGGFKQGIGTMARIVSRRTAGKTFPSVSE